MRPCVSNSHVVIIYTEPPAASDHNVKRNLINCKCSEGIDGSLILHVIKLKIELLK